MNPKSIIVIFGATGDLAKRKLFPSLYRLYEKGHLNERFAVVGVARRPLSADEFRHYVRDSVETALNQELTDGNFISHFYYHPFDVTEAESYQRLKALLEQLDETYQTEGNRIFYLAMAPEFFGTVTSRLQSERLTDTRGFKRLVIEKPFGHDLVSAQKLNEEIRRVFSEREIYRIDHYLGKEMVQNIEVIRFSNAIFEPLWNNRFISNIQITSSETLGVEDRGRYYDHSGALRDMVQNHMLQMVALLAMEPPIKLTTDDIRHEKVKVLRALRPVAHDEVDQYFV
ncbi:glucose-6-phosphate dehydrogenase, partial [Geobacillus thermodenitrificans]